MTVSKKTRFEVFKRDGFVCAYCGKHPPAVTLEVDHIDPVSLGGIDDASNLITACFDCNRGKTNVPLTRIIPKISENTEELKEKEEQLKEYRKLVRKIVNRKNKDISEISAVYQEQYTGWDFSDKFKRVSLTQFLSLLPKEEIKESLHIAIARFPRDDHRVIKYFCGVCWKKIRDMGGGKA